MQHVYEVYGNKINKAYVKELYTRFQKGYISKIYISFVSLGETKRKTKGIYISEMSTFLKTSAYIYIYIYKRLQRLKIWKMFYDNNLRITRSLNSFLSL